MGFFKTAAAVFLGMTVSSAVIERVDMCNESSRNYMLLYTGYDLLSEKELVEFSMNKIMYAASINFLPRLLEEDDIGAAVEMIQQNHYSCLVPFY